MDVKHMNPATAGMHRIFISIHVHK